MRAAGAAAALLLENERLDAELRARYDELRASRARLVAAGDAARRRLERDLHDGAQQRFVALALKLRLARNGWIPTAGRRAARRGDGRAEPGARRAARAGARHAPGRADRARRSARRCPRSPRARRFRRRSPATCRGGCRRRSRSRSTSSSPRRSRTSRSTRDAERRRRAARADRARVAGRGARRRGRRRRRVARAAGSSGIADRVAALDGELQVESPPGGGTCAAARRSRTRAAWTARRRAPVAGVGG